MKKNVEELPFLKNITSFALLTGGIAHDLNNALSGISGYFQLLFDPSFGINSENSRLDEKTSSYIEACYSSLENAANLTKFLLLLSRKFYKDYDNDILSTDIGQILEKIRKSKLWDKKKFKLRVIGANKIPTLQFPAPILTLIFNEIISNSHSIAKHYTKPVTLTLSLEYFPKGSLLKIIGKDTGPGYDKNMIKNKTYKNKFTGLHMLSEIAYRLGGWMEIENDKRGGARLELAIIV